MTVAAHKRTSAAESADMNAQWRIRCTVLEERLADPVAALRASEEARRELSADYKHVLNRLWTQSAGLTTRRER